VIKVQFLKPKAPKDASKGWNRTTFCLLRGYIHIRNIFIELAELILLHFVVVSYKMRSKLSLSAPSWPMQNFQRMTAYGHDGSNSQIHSACILYSVCSVYLKRALSQIHNHNHFKNGVFILFVWSFSLTYFFLCCSSTT
jgi:hypothetical protein